MPTGRNSAHPRTSPPFEKPSNVDLMTISPPTPRSLTQMLRERDDVVLVRMLVDRPDLAFPAPTDFSEVASRATTRHSVTEALGVLNAVEVWVATLSARTTAPFAAADLPTGEADPAAVRAALQRLVDLGLVWGHAGELTSLRAVRAMAALLEDVDPGPAPDPAPPTLSFETRSSSTVDKVAAGSAFELVRRMDVLLEHCDHLPLTLRRDGGLATREVRALAGLLDVSSEDASTMADLACRAGLLGLGSIGNHEVLMPTRAFDDWQTLPLADQWAVLIETWFAHHADSGTQALKRIALEAFGDPSEGRAVSPDDVLRWVAWHRPRRPARSDKAVRTFLRQAAWLGVTGLGAVASFAPTVDAKALDALLPDRVDHVLIQADLTAVAPGPLTPDAAHDLGLLADVESRGGATVYRISPGSLARAHGLGWGVDEILATLQKRSRTPLPQALEYLVRDLERRGPATTDALTPHHHRDPARGTAVVTDDLTAEDRLDPTMAADVVAALRAGAEPSPRVVAVEQDHGGEPLFDSPLATLREAVETGEIVWVGYVDPLGTAGERLVRADVVDDGLLRARDARSDDEFAVAVHRITAAHIIRAGPR